MLDGRSREARALREKEKAMAKKSEKKGLESLADVRLPAREPGESVVVGQVIRVSVNDIRREPEQPRTFPPPGPALDAMLADITSSIAWNEDAGEPVEGKDLITPVELRRTEEGEGPEPYTLVDGERRWRSAKVCGFVTIRAVVIEISRADVLARQVLHAQGRPLTPLEMADAVARLMTPAKGKKKGPSAAEIAERIGLGKLPRPVHEYLALASLGQPARDALASGAIGVRVALELAGIASREEQGQAVDEIVPTGARKPMSTGAAIDWIRSHYHRRLKAAIFNTGDPKLVPSAGACSSCRHNTATQAQLFAENDGDARCTKSACWNEKTAAAVGARGAEPEAEKEEPKKTKRNARDPKLSDAARPPVDEVEDSFARTRVEGDDEVEEDEPASIPSLPPGPSTFSPLAARDGDELLRRLRGARMSFGPDDWAALVVGIEDILDERPIVRPVRTPDVEAAEEAAEDAAEGRCRVCGCSDDSPCTDPDHLVACERSEGVPGVCSFCSDVMVDVEDTIAAARGGLTREEIHRSLDDRSDEPRDAARDDLALDRLAHTGVLELADFHFYVKKTKSAAKPNAEPAEPTEAPPLTPGERIRVVAAGQLQGREGRYNKAGEEAGRVYVTLDPVKRERQPKRLLMPRASIERA